MSKEISEFNDDINPLSYVGYALSLSQNDERQKLFREQRDSDGFDETEIWSLKTSIAKFILPRLISLKNALDYYQGSKKPNQDIVLAISAFDILANGKLTSRKEDETIRLGLEAFARVYMGLWF